MIELGIFVVLWVAIGLIAYGAYSEGVGRERERWERRINYYPFLPIEDRPATRDDDEPLGV